MRDVNSLVETVFSGLPALVVENMTDQGEVIRLAARTRHEAVPCPKCGTPTARVNGHLQAPMGSLCAPGGTRSRTNFLSADSPFLPSQVSGLPCGNGVQHGMELR
jgi:hypothetical protein